MPLAIEDDLNACAGCLELRLLWCVQAEKYICEEVNKTGKKHNLRGFERIKAVILDTEQFTVENGLQTPSFKLKRPQLQKHYQKQIDKKYADIKKSS